jgi:hypothetical protein
MDITGKLVVAAVTNTETRIWATDAHRGDKPEVVALDVNVPALTEPQILAAAREWFDDHKNG